MADLSKASLDRLFKQGLEAPQLDYNPAAWADLAVRLQRRQRRRRLLWFWLVLAVGLSILYGVYSTRPKLDLTPRSHQGPSNANLPWQAQRYLFWPGSPAADTLAAHSGLIQPHHPGPDLHAEPTLPFFRQPAAIPRLKVPQTGAAIQKLPHSGRLRRFGATLGDTTFLEKQQSFESIGSTPVVMGHHPTKPTDSGHDARREVGPHADLGKIQPRPLTILVDSAREEFAPPPETWAKAPSERGLNLVIMVGVEQNSVGSGAFDSLGRRVGLGMEYRLGRHWSLGLGVQYAKRNYVAGSGEYQAPPGYWTDAIAPTATRGYCKMLEVPLYFTFYPQPYQKRGWLFSAGLQSYWVLKEYYRYQYEKAVPNQRLRWKGLDTDQAYSGFLQFGGGYQTPLVGRCWLDVQPYFQIPLQRMGHGQLNIRSVGLNVRLKYLGR